MQASSCLSASGTFHVSPTCVRRSEGHETGPACLDVPRLSWWGIRVPSSSDRQWSSSGVAHMEKVPTSGWRTLLKVEVKLLDLPVGCGSESVLRGELLLQHTEGNECWTPPR